MTMPLNPSRRRFVLVACEASGDLLGEGLAQQLRARFPDCELLGIGGARMEAAGVTLWRHYDVLNIMGLVEVVKHLPALLKLRRELVRWVKGLRPDAYIGIDGPDFNLRVERQLKQAGIHTLHYVSPSIWAWREGRARKIRASAERVICLFPMEPPIYARYGMPASYIGHPLADSIGPEPDHGAARTALGMDPAATVLGVLPGSRVSEVERLGRVFLQAVVLLRRQFASLRVLVPMANDSSRYAFERVVADLGTPLDGESVVVSASELGQLADHLQLVGGRSHEVMAASDVLLLASGTAALEGMLAKRPMVVAYKVNALTGRIVRALGLLKVDRYSLPNVLAERALVPELIQEDCTPERVAAALLPLLQGQPQVAEQLREFHRQHARLQGTGSAGAAAAVAEVIGAPTPP